MASNQEPVASANSGNPERAPVGTSTSGNPIPSTSGNQTPPTVNSKTFGLHVPKNYDRSVFIAKFSKNFPIDFTQWREHAPEMNREVATVEDGRTEEDKNTKLGAGSGTDLGKQKRDAARRKYHPRPKNPADAPWILTETSDPKQKKYRGTREGGVQENSEYFVFKPTKDGKNIEAYPIVEWYNFVPIQRYKTLDAEEAEEAFARRDKIVNYAGLMNRLRRKKSGDGEDETGDADGSSRPKPILKISDGSYVEPGEMSDSDDEVGVATKLGVGRKSKPKTTKRAVKRFRQSGDNGLDNESDDGDFETREMDYASSASEDELLFIRNQAAKGIEEEMAKPVDAGEEEEDVTEQKDNEPWSESDADGDDIDAIADKCLPKARVDSSAGSSTRVLLPKKTPSGKEKRPAQDSVDRPTPKPPKVTKSEVFQQSPAVVGGNLDTESLVRKYLEREPITSQELLRKLAKHGINLTNISVQLGVILKRLNLERTMVNGKLHLHLKK